MKKLFLIIFLLLSIFLIAVDADIYTTDLGWMQYGDGTYANARNATTAENLTTATYLAIGQREGVEYDVYRTFMSFAIPEMESASACTLKVYGRQDSSDDDFILYVLSADDSATELTTADYNAFDGWVSEDTFTGVNLIDSYTVSTNFVDDAYNNLIFNAAGIDSLEAASGDYLWIVILSKEDYDNSAPGSGRDEYVLYELDTEDQEPYLSINYTPAGWTGKACGVENPKGILGILKASVKNFLGVE